MYTRGQLALIGNVGRKAIRLYEQEGLLETSRIDENNGYHYYNNEQVERLQKIKQYKTFGLSLAEIRQILDNHVTEEELFSEKKQELDDTIKSMQELRNKMDKCHLEDNTNTVFEINESVFPKCSCIFIEENVELEKLGISVGKLYEQAAKNKLQVIGSHFVKYEGVSEDDVAFKMTTCLPIMQIHNDEESQNIRIEDSAKCIHMNVTDGFSKVGEAHIQLKEYMDKEGLLGTGTVYEVFNHDLSVDIYYRFFIAG